MTSQVVRALEKRELITRTASPADKRAVLLAPTKAGIDLANRAVTAVESVDRQFFAALGNDVSTLTTLMQNWPNSLSFGSRRICRSATRPP